jgi:hypothetical protein
MESIQDVEREFNQLFTESAETPQEVDEDEVMADALAAIREYRNALKEVREAYQDIPESEINADIDLALEQIRTERDTKKS